MVPDCRSNHPDDDDKRNHVSGNTDVVDGGMFHAALDEQRRAQNDRSEDDRDDQPVDDRFNAVDEFVLAFETQSEFAAPLVQGVKQLFNFDRNLRSGFYSTSESYQIFIKFIFPVELALEIFFGKRTRDVHQ